MIRDVVRDFSARSSAILLYLYQWLLWLHIATYAGVPYTHTHSAAGSTSKSAVREPHQKLVGRGAVKQVQFGPPLTGLFRPCPGLLWIAEEVSQNSAGQILKVRGANAHVHKSTTSLALASLLPLLCRRSNLESIDRIVSRRTEVRQVFWGVGPTAKRLQKEDVSGRNWRG